MYLPPPSVICANRSLCRNNFLLVTLSKNLFPIKGPLLGRHRKKGLSKQLNPLLFLVELARIELAAS